MDSLDISDGHESNFDGWMLYGPNTNLPDGPKTLTLEITTRCNLTCVMCPHGIEHGMQNKRDAPDILVDSILDTIDTIDEIHPTGVGEPLMADGFWRIVDVLKDREAPKLVFHTNGILLTQRNVERIAQANVGRVNISVDAANELTYKCPSSYDLAQIMGQAKRDFAHRVG